MCARRRGHFVLRTSCDRDSRGVYSRRSPTHNSPLPAKKVGKIFYGELLQRVPLVSIYCFPSLPFPSCTIIALCTEHAHIIIMINMIVMIV